MFKELSVMVTNQNTNGQGEKSCGVLEAAYAYLRAGLSFIPIAGDGSKRPDGRLLPKIANENGTQRTTWKPFQERTPTEEETRRWFAGSNPPGVAVIGGAVSGNLECIDFDREAQTIFPAWCELVEVEAPGLIGRLSIARTPKPGFHVRYRCPEVTIPGNLKLATDPGAPREEQTLIETRGEGGYALAPGCPPKCHPSGRTYDHHSGPKLSQVENITAAEREILIRCACSFDRAGSEDRGTFGAGTRPGDDFNQRGPDWAEVLGPHGWQLVRVQGPARYWRRAGKDGPGWSATTGVCTSKAGNDLFACFSSNAAPFEGPANGRPCSTYSKFAAFALLNHNGDFASAAKALVRQGYGQPSHQANGQASKVEGQPGETEPWEPPVIRNEVPPAPFPLDCLPAPLRDYALEVAQSMPCPVDMPACHILAAAATAIGNTRQLKLKTSWYERSRLWIALVSKPGSKKSPAAKAAQRPIRQEQRRLRKKYEADIREYNAALLQWKADADQAKKDKQPPPPEPKEPVEGQVFTTDTTREALADLLKENTRGLVLVRDELAGWARSLNQYKGGRGDDKQFWLSLWSGEMIFVNRRGRKVHIDDPFICVVGNLPPDVLSELNDERSREDGFIHRILFAWPDPVPPGWTDLEPDPLTIQAYADVFRKLFSLKMRPGKNGEGRPRTLRFTADGKKLFVEFSRQLAADLVDETFPDQLRGPWSKFEGYCARLALVLHVCRYVCGETTSRDVDGPSVDAAVRLIEYFQAHARRVYPMLQSEAGIRLEKDVQAVLAWIARRGEPSFTWHQCYRDLGDRFQSPDELSKVLELLGDRGFIRERSQERQGKTGRKPKGAYDVHPSVFATTSATSARGSSGDFTRVGEGQPNGDFVSSVSPNGGGAGVGVPEHRDAWEG